VFTLDRDDILKTLHDHSSSSSCASSSSASESEAPGGGKAGPFNNETTIQPEDEVDFSIFDFLDDDTFSPMSVDDGRNDAHASGTKAQASPAKAVNVPREGYSTDDLSSSSHHDGDGAFEKMFADISLTDSIQFNIGKPGQSSSSQQTSRKTPLKKPSSTRRKVRLTHPLVSVRVMAARSMPGFMSR